MTIDEKIELLKHEAEWGLKNYDAQDVYNAFEMLLDIVEELQNEKSLIN